MKYIYALYKGDTFIDLGTASELAEKRGCTPKYIKYLASPTNLKCGNNHLIAIRIGKDNDNLEEEE